MDKLSADRLRYLLSYDPETGVFTWKNPASPCRVQAGDLAGTKRKEGHIIICVDRHRIMAHRLAWLYMTGEWPEREIDHRDTDGSNNRWANLREATSAQNKANTRRRGDNTSGYKGVCFYKRKGKYIACIRHKGRQIHLGYFDDPELAHAAYVDAANRLFGEFARAA